MNPITQLYLAFWLLLLYHCGASQEISTLLTHPTIADAQVGIQVTSLPANKSIYSHDAHVLLIPASTQKLLTGITALEQLGGDHQIETEIRYSGTISSDGTLSGDLIIIGAHDPTLGSNRIKSSPPLDHLLDLVANKISQTITCIDGQVVIVTPSSTSPYHPYRYWLYEDLGNYYGTPSFPINIQENTYHVTLSRSTNKGQVCQVVSTHPADLGLSISSEVTIGAAGSGDQAYILGSPGDHHVTIVGTLPPGNSNYTIKGSIPNPPLYFARRLYQVLVEHGVASQGYQVMDTYDGASKKITSIESPPLRDLVQVVHQRSNNLYTEAIYHTLSLPNLSLGDGHKMVDACGLSPMNRISALQLVDFLTARGVPSKELQSTLSIAGRSGTLKQLLRQAPYNGKIYAKSGSMSGVLCYAGYMDTPDGWRAFAVMINGVDHPTKDVKPIAEQIMKALFDL